MARLDRRLRDADLVITGEGAIDASTFMGKGAGQIASRCLELEVRCIGLAGEARVEKLNGLKGLDTLNWGKKGQGGFAEVRALIELTTIEEAKTLPAVWLERLARRVGEELGKRSLR